MKLRVIKRCSFSSSVGVEEGRKPECYIRLVGPCDPRVADFGSYFLRRRRSVVPHPPHYVVNSIKGPYVPRPAKIAHCAKCSCTRQLSVEVTACSGDFEGFVTRGKRLRIIAATHCHVAPDHLGGERLIGFVRRSLPSVLRRLAAIAEVPGRLRSVEECAEPQWFDSHRLAPGGKFADIVAAKSVLERNRVPGLGVVWIKRDCSLELRLPLLAGSKS